MNNIRVIKDLIETSITIKLLNKKIDLKIIIYL